VASGCRAARHPAGRSLTISDDPANRILAAIRTPGSEPRTGMTTLRTETITLRTEITTLRVKIMDRIDRLRDSVTGPREDAGVNFARGDRVDERSNGIEREMRAMGVEMSATQRQIQRLQTGVRTLKGEP
jgi:hypothetical protein